MAVNGALTNWRDNPVMPKNSVSPAVPAAGTSFDIALWFMERARTEDSYLQPRKLQSLMFLAQAHFAAAYGGRRLMPSVFVFDDGGPLDPNVYRAFEHGRPTITETPLDRDVLVFLDAIWRRYGDTDALRLDQLIARRGEGEAAVCRRDGSEVDLAAMRRMFSSDSIARRGPTRTLRSHTGRPVTVRKWVPGRPSSA
jgi:uncharacterized phage-associated protein